MNRVCIDVMAYMYSIVSIVYIRTGKAYLQAYTITIAYNTYTTILNYTTTNALILPFFLCITSLSIPSLTIIN